MGLVIVSNGDKGVEAVVGRALVVDGPVVHLSPMRPAGDGARDGVHRGEVLRFGSAVVLVYRDVCGVASVSSGEPEVVGGSKTYFDGECDVGSGLLHPAVDFVECLGDV